jgi:DNA-3-methyladenine glycosylase
MRCMTKRLSREFYARDSIDVARDLLGKNLVHRLADGRQLHGHIVETEAYLGIEDPAAHSYGGRRTPRTEPMFGEPGLSYIYFIYGMYFCFNVVTGAKDIPEAVLVRALDGEGADGPGKLCRALQLDRRHNALDLVQSEVLWIEDDGALTNVEIAEGPRVGIGDSHDGVHWPLRYGIKNHPSLSKPKFSTHIE